MGKFAELKNLSLFNFVSVKFDTIEWANHLDIDPEVLYESFVRKKRKDWREAHNKSLHGTQKSNAPVSFCVMQTRTEMDANNAVDILIS